MNTALSLALPLLALCLSNSQGTERGDARNAANFLGRGAPTFVLGTAGDDRCDRGVAAQVRFLRGVLFPDSPIVSDSDFDAAKGAQAWPAVPVLYGASHVNKALAAVSEQLPFQIDSGRLEIAGQVYEGEEYRLIAVVPSEPAGGAGPGYPNFLLYAGTGTPGVIEINAVQDYGFGFVVADRFGRLASGRFVREASGTRAEITETARRLPWRAQRVLLEGELGHFVVHRLELEPVDALDAAENAACARGIAAAARRLGLDQVVGLEVYVYPDRRSKKQLCWSGGDGNAEAGSASLHVLPFDAGDGGAMEHLMQHESTHILATRAFGTPGSALWGEGLAVWIADGYGGRKLDSFKDLAFPRGTDLQSLMGAAFFRAPEGQSYPLAGSLVRDLVEEHGLTTFLERLYPVAPADFPAACEALGTSVEQLTLPYTKKKSGS